MLHRVCVPVPRVSVPSPMRVESWWHTQRTLTFRLSVSRLLCAADTEQPPAAAAAMCENENWFSTETKKGVRSCAATCAECGRWDNKNWWWRRRLHDTNKYMLKVLNVLNGVFVSSVPTRRVGKSSSWARSPPTKPRRQYRMPHKTHRCRASIRK